MLLHWSTLLPEGTSNLAAVRFSGPVSITSISVFPTGARPFANLPEIVARTEPDAFVAQIYLHSLPLDPKEKSLRAPNALVTTSIAYSGTEVKFPITSFEYATRLIIFHGDFTALSVAIYGNTISADPPPSKDYISSQLSPIGARELSPTVDPSVAQDPTHLANQLLTLLPDQPPMPLLTRLMFCLKAPEDDWDSDEFPYIFATWEDPPQSIDDAVACTKKPIQDEVSTKDAEDFANLIVSILGEKSSGKDADIASLLYNLSCQPPAMLEALLPRLELESVFTLESMDEGTILDLLDAASNPIIARHLDREYFEVLLSSLSASHKAEKQVQAAARRLRQRIVGWRALDRAMAEVQGDLTTAISLIKDICNEESSFAIWLASMLTQSDLRSKLLPPLPQKSSSTLTPLFDISHAITYNDFFTFIKALVGVACVLVVLAWADSIGHDALRERTLAILHLWQSANGYRQILNHLLPMRQFANRLEWMSDNNLPRNSGKLAERIIAELVTEPHSMLNSNLIQTVLALRHPLSHIHENERLLMRKIALVVDDGIPAALEELVYSGDRPLSLRRIRTLRTTLLMVDRELSSVDGDRHVLEALWDVSPYSIIGLLTDLFCIVEEDLRDHCGLQVPPSANQPTVGQLFLVAGDTLGVLKQFAALKYPLPPRWLRQLTIAIANIFAYTNVADTALSQTSPACIAAQAMRQTCIDVLRFLISQGVGSEDGQPAAQIILKTLFKHTECTNVDPVHHISQIFCLVDYLLPMEATSPEASHILSAIPHSLIEMWSLFSVVDTDDKAHLIRRLVVLDVDRIGAADWLLFEELKSLQTLITLTKVLDRGDDFIKMIRALICLSLRLLKQLVEPSTSTSAWCIDCLEHESDTSKVLAACFAALVSGSFVSSNLTALLTDLSTHISRFGPSLAFAITLAILHSKLSPTIVLRGLQGITPASVDWTLLAQELGRYLCTQQTQEMRDSALLIDILRWIISHTASLPQIPGLTGHLLDVLSSRFPSELVREIDTIRSSILLDSSDDAMVPALIELDESVELPLWALQSLLQPPVPTRPVTPNGTRTPDVLGLLESSPPAALFRSPAAVGLTKTYLNNDFRQLRQVSARQNTSRLPSMHVDEFEMNSLASPFMVPTPMPSLVDDPEAQFVPPEIPFM